MSKPRMLQNTTALAIVLIAIVCQCAGATGGTDALFQKGCALLQRGDLEGAADAFSKAADESRQSAQKVECMVQLAAIRQNQGHFDSAQSILDDALTADRASDGASLAAIQMLRGLNAAYMRHWNDASAALDEAMSAAKRCNDPRRVAMVLTNLANVQALWGDPTAALSTARQAMQLTATAGDPLLDAQACASAAAAAVASSDPDAADLLQQSMTTTESLEPSYDKASLLLLIGGNEQRLLERGDGTSVHLERGYIALHEAEQIGQSLQIVRINAESQAALGALYELNGRHDDALKLTRQAILIAQQQNMRDRLYRWQWQAARIMRARGDEADATIAAYQRTVAGLHDVRADVAIGFGNVPPPADAGSSAFRQSCGDLFSELADLLLKRGGEADLRSARDAVESLKTAELEDYFQSDCATISRAKFSDVEKLIDPHTAAIYIIPLADRTEMLVSLSGQRIIRVSAKITRDDLMREAAQFRADLEDRTAHAYKISGKALYDALIAPLEPTLHENDIQTLVFVPDDKLRTIPMAAIWDGEGFLVARYATAVVPGLTLMRTEPPTGPLTILAGGITGPEQGYPALRRMGSEIEQIRAIYKGQSLLDSQFTQEQFQRDLDQNRFGIIHIATHGEFSPDSAKTFVLTHGGRMDLDALSLLITPSQFRGAPVQLLTLSACDTAAGDDRAALGLAGVALKAGARSALASLWSVNDRVSAELIADFYRQYHQAGDRGKAIALQRRPASIS